MLMPCLLPHLTLFLLGRDIALHLIVLITATVYHFLSTDNLMALLIAIMCSSKVHLVYH